MSEWYQYNPNNFKRLTREQFQKEYMAELPRVTFLDWVEELANQMDGAEKPNPRELSYDEFFKRLGAYETQELIVQKLRYAIEFEKRRLESDARRKNGS